MSTLNISALNVYYFNGSAFLRMTPVFNQTQDRFSAAFMDVEHRIKRVITKMKVNQVVPMIEKYVEQTHTNVIIFPQSYYDLTYNQIMNERSKEMGAIVPVRGEL